jgi:hypothetical protein
MTLCWDVQNIYIKQRNDQKHKKQDLCGFSTGRPNDRIMQKLELDLSNHTDIV